MATDLLRRWSKAGPDVLAAGPGCPVRLRPGQSAELGRDSVPWVVTDLTRLLVLWTVSVFALVICWYRAGGEVTWNEQAPWLIAAMGSTALAVMGVVGWITKGMRNLKTAERQIISAYQQVHLSVTGVDLYDSSSVTTDPLTGLADDRRITAPGMTRYHRTACALVQGKETRIVANRQITGEQLLPCGVCRA